MPNLTIDGLIQKAKVTPILLILLSPFTASAAHECQRYTYQIDDIKEVMREGYSVRQGKYLKKRLARLQDKRISCERKVENSKASQSTGLSKAQLKRLILLQDAQINKLKHQQKRYRRSDEERYTDF